MTDHKIIGQAEQTECEENLKEIADVALDAGRILLKSGAEIFRVEETIVRICRRFRIDEIDTFVMSNGIFLSAGRGKEEVFTKVKHVPLSYTNLEAVAEVNDLSRRITAGKVGLEEARDELKRIEAMPFKKARIQVLAAGAGAGFFGYFLGSTALESLAAFGIGGILYIWVIISSRYNVTKMVTNVFGGMLITVLAVAIYVWVPIPMGLDGMIIASILPLVPGVAFVNAIRDIANSDFLSGTIRILDALLGFVYIAVGVGVALGIFSNLIGGIRP